MKYDFDTLIGKVVKQYEGVEFDKEAKPHGVSITNIAFDKDLKLSHWEMGTLILVSQFNIISGSMRNLKTMRINIGMIKDSLISISNDTAKHIAESLDSLQNKGVITIEFISNSYKDKYRNMFVVHQKTRSRKEQLSERDFQAYDGVSDYDDMELNSSATTLYLEDIGKILSANVTPNNKFQMLTVYAGICYNIFYVKRGKGVSELDKKEAGSAVNFHKLVEIGDRVGFVAEQRTRRIIKLLVQNEVIGRYDVGYKGVNALFTKMYLSRFADIPVMQRYIIIQIKEKEVLNIFSNNYK